MMFENIKNEELEKIINTILSSTPFFSLVIRNSDKVIVAANQIALDYGVKIGDYCWNSLKKGKYLSDADKKLVEKYKDKIPANLRIKCTFCQADECFLGNPQQYNTLELEDKIWDVYWIKLTDDLFLHQLIDKTEHYKKEKDLIFINSLLTTQLETSLSGILVIDTTGKILIYNQRFLDLWQPPEEIIANQNYTDLAKYIYSKIETPIENITCLEKLLKDPTKKSHDIIKLFDGRIFDCYSSPINDSSNSYYGRVWYFTDVTERQLYEEKIKEREEKYRTLFDNAGDAIIIHDQKGRIITLNEVALKRYGYTCEELRGLNLNMIDNPENAVEIPYRMRKILETGQLNFETIHLSKTGLEIPTEVNARLIKWSNKYAIMSICRDITERKKNEKEIRASEQMHRSIIEAALDAFCIVDLQGNVVEVNNSACQMYGYSRNELLSMKISDIEVIEDPQTIKEHIHKIINQGQDRFITKHRRKNGEIIDVEVSVQYRNIDKGLIVCFLRDITKILEDQAKLKASEEKYRNIIETAFNGFLLIDNKANIREVNTTYCNLSGYSKEELLNMRINDLEAKENQKEVAEHVEKIITTGFDVFESLHRRKDGSVFPVEIRVKHIKENDGYMVAFIQDITTRKQFEQKIQEDKIRLENILEGMHAGTWEWNVQTGETKFNEIWANIIGYTLEELSPVSIDTWIKFTHPDDLKKSNELLAAHFAGKSKQYECECRMKHKDGHWVWILDRGKLLQWTPDGKPLLMFGTHLDITERKRLEEEIKETLRFQQSLMNAIPTPVFYKNREARYLGCNTAFEEYFGVAQKDLIGKTVYDIAPKELADIYAKSDDDLFANPGKQKYESILKTSYGSERNVMFHKATYKDLSGKVAGIIGIIVDITDQKKAENEIHQAYEKLEGVLESLNDSIIIVDPYSRKIIHCNSATSRIFGYSQEELLGQETIILHVDKEHFEKFGNEALKAYDAKGYYATEFVMKHRSGKVFPTEHFVRPLREPSGRIKYVVSLVRDITERKLAEQALIESELRYRTLFEQASVGIAITTPEGHYLSANKKLLDMLEYSLEELVMLKLSDVFVEEEKDQISNYLNNLQKNKHLITEWKLISKTGKVILVEISEGLLPNGNHLAFIQDVTKRKEAEQKVSQTANLLNKTEELAHFGSWEYDLIDNKLSWSDETYRIFGLEPQKTPITYERFIHSVHPEDREKVDYAYTQSLLESNDANEIEHRIIKVNTGEIRIVYQKWEHYKDERGRIIRTRGFIQDITQRKKIESALLEHERLSAIYELASGVAHDFNNSLQTIIGNIELALLTKENFEEIYDYLHNIKKVAIDATSRVKQLQKIASKELAVSFQPIDLIKLLDETIEIIKPICEATNIKINKIAIEKKYQPITSVDGNWNELQNAIKNLLLNAVEAMPTGGVLTLETEQTQEHVVLRISDTGRGMDESTAKRVFQPFFTTKGYELGRGLGLSTTYSIINNHKGNVHIKETAINKGTTFEVILPIGKLQKTKAPKPPKPLETPKMSAKILWVDDEPSIRFLGKKLINKLGYQVEVAENGDQALALLEKEKFDIVITDLGMPGMSGWQLAETIKKRYNLKVAILTGWGTELTSEEKVKYGVDFVVGKPINLQELQNIINKMLTKE